MRFRLWGASLLLAMCCALWSVRVAGAQSVDDEARAIGQELQCPVCQGLSVADSPSQLATQMRGVIRAKLEAGESRQQILDYFAERYGETILLSPPRAGFGAVIWIAPYVALLGALAFVGWRVYTSTTRAASPSADPPPLAPDIASYVEEVDRTYASVRDQPLR